MFKSKDVNESQFLKNTTLSKLGDACNGVPKITSTPLNSHISPSRRNKVLLSPAFSRQGIPRRYSLSEASPSTSRTNIRPSTVESPGPLLSSLNYKDNVSLYEETKSSGLARRIVLYNEDAEQEKRPTHQEKYNSPGLFPIVHLFKSKPPLLEQSPKRVKIKLSSPEHVKNYSPQHRSKILEGLTRPRFQRQQSLPSYGHSDNTSTKSVLDALKEISRKRIHSNEDHDLSEDNGKRIRTAMHNGSVPTSSKRARADSPLLDSSSSPPTKQTQKRMCVYDEFSASKSSSDFSFLTKSEPLKSKRKTTSTSTESLTENKQVKLVNVETQTLATAGQSKITSTISEDQTEKPRRKQCPIKVFDDAPLERIRKSRLAALMGNLAGKDACISISIVPGSRSKKSVEKVKEKVVEENLVTPPPVVEENTKPSEETSKIVEENQDKPVISILSPPKSTKESSILKLDRHVQFDVASTSNPLCIQPTLTQTSASIVTPIVSDSVSKSPITETNKKALETSVSLGSLPKPLASNNLASSFSFGTPVSSKTEPKIPNSSTVAPTFNFSKPESPVKAPISAASTSSPPKQGGFKFDLKLPASSSMAFGTNTTTPSVSAPVSILNLVTTASSPVSFGFGKPSTENKTPSFSFGASNAQVSKSSDNPLSAGLSKSQVLNFGSSTPDPKPQTPGFSFGSNAGSPKLGGLASIQPSSTLMFGSATTTTVTSTAAISSSPFSVTTTSSFGIGTTPAFAASTNSAFGDSLNKPTPTFSFGASTPVTTSSAFGSKPTPMFGAGNTTASTPFALSGSKTTENPSFGNKPTTSLTFGSAPTTSASVFGNNSMPSFGNSQATTASVFGTAPATTAPSFGITPSTAPVFGNASVGFKPPVTASAGFGSSQPTFGSNPTTTASVFGSADTKTSTFGSSNVFGTTTQASTFGGGTTGAFGASSLFGSPATSAFNAATTTSTTSVPAFGSNPAPSFSFGANKPAANPFGAAATTASNTFGTSSAFPSSNNFNSSSGFGVGGPPPAFGSAAATPSPFGASSTPTFGQIENKPPAFGQTENKPTFAFGATDNKPSSVFGSASDKSAFGKPANTQPSGFGNLTSGFGSSTTSGFSTSQPQTNGGFNFNSNPNATPAAPSPFAFGSGSGSTEPPKPSFNFTGGTSNPPAFGASSSSSAFGSPAPSFGSPAQPFAAAGAPAGGVFTIGSGASTGRPRTQLRAKRRT